ncbi:imelysin family protein [Aquabacter sp. CN5-332]|uniref:imelysin family protein n=1 Tax=Aquabacter sp. CN5-332 TaxID=3156608 RepID=UPI0032B5950A
MKTLFGPLAIAVAAFAGLAAPAKAATAPALDPVVLIESWLLPRYDALVATTAAQKDAWTAFCAAPAPAGVPGLKAAFLKAADAWSAVEFVTMGPVTLSLRPDRFNFFPDRRNAIQRGMAEVLASTDTSRFEPERFARSNAATQGLPALERLLYDEGADAALAGGPEASVRCMFGSAIAVNLATIAKEVRTGWGDRATGALGAIISRAGDPALFPDVGAVPGMILTDLSGAYQRVTDVRILPVLNNGDPKPMLAEGWRSGRSGQVVKVMITSADALLQEVAKQLPSRPQWAVNKAAAAADKAAAEFPANLGGNGGPTPEDVVKIQAAVKAFKSAQVTVYRPIASYFGISLGFNALDGD